MAKLSLFPHSKESFFKNILDPVIDPDHLFLIYYIIISFKFHHNSSKILSYVANRQTNQLCQIHDKNKKKYFSWSK